MLKVNSRDCATVIDYVVVLKEVMKNVRDAKVIPEKK